MMDDLFLYQFRKQPPPEFAEKLFEKINLEEKERYQRSLVLKVSWSLGILFVTLSLLLLASPSVRAQIERIVKQIGEMVFYEVEQLPPLPQDFNGTTTPVAINAIDLDDAQDNLPFDIAIPTWVPSGFELVNVDVIGPLMNGDEPSWFILMSWEKNVQGNKTTLFLTARQIDTHEMTEIGPTLVGPDSLEEIEINGKPAALIRGGWLNHYSCSTCDKPAQKPTPTPYWYDNGQIKLMWIDEGISYELVFGDYYDSVADMVRMAESMQ